MSNESSRRLMALRVASAAAIVLWAAFIFGFSGQTGGESGSLSARVADALVSVGDWLTGAATTGDTRIAAIEALQFPIRKAAHMSEYAVLALLVFWQLRLWPAFSGVGLSLRVAAGKVSARKEAVARVGASTAGGLTNDGAPEQGTNARRGESAIDTETPWNLYLRTLRKAILVAWTIATLYAATDEFHQLFVPGRAGLFADVLIDATGAAIGLLLVGSIIALAKRPR